MKHFRPTFILFAIMLVFTPCQSVFASQTVFQTRSASSNSTKVGGIIKINTTWMLENSPYIFIDDVTVAERVTLTIEPGVIVNMDLWSLIVEGTLYAKGNESNRIMFCSSEKPLGARPRIYFTERSMWWDETTGAGCVIQYAEINVVNYMSETIRGGSPKISNSIIFNYANDASAIFLDGGGIISNNTITGGYRGISAGSSLVLHNVIHHASVGIGCSYWSAGPIYHPEIMGNLIMDCGVGISVVDSPYISNNTLIRNQKGFHFPDYSFLRGASPCGIIYNNIISTSYNVLVEKEDPRIIINMTHNWWGTTNSSLIDQKIYDQKDNRRLCLVNYTPFLNEPHSSVSFYVRCVDGDNENLVGLTVKLHDSTGQVVGSKITNSTGWVKFTSLIPDNYIIKAYWMGIKVLDENLTLTREEQTDIQCAVHDLVVHAVSEKGDNLPNTVATLSWLNGTKIDSKSTNSTGHAMFENLPIAIYSVKASLEGYREKSGEINLTSEDQIATMTLQSIPFIETPTGISTISGVTVLSIIVIIIILKKRLRA